MGVVASQLNRAPNPLSLLAAAAYQWLRLLIVVQDAVEAAVQAISQPVVLVHSTSLTSPTQQHPTAGKHSQQSGHNKCRQVAGDALELWLARTTLTPNS